MSPNGIFRVIPISKKSIDVVRKLMRPEVLTAEVRDKSHGIHVGLVFVFEIGIQPTSTNIYQTKAMATPPKTNFITDV